MNATLVPHTPTTRSTTAALGAVIGDDPQGGESTDPARSWRVPSLLLDPDFRRFCSDRFQYFKEELLLQAPGNRKVSREWEQCTVRTFPVAEALTQQLVRPEVQLFLQDFGMTLMTHTYPNINQCLTPRNPGVPCDVTLEWRDGLGYSYSVKMRVSRFNVLCCGLFSDAEDIMCICEGFGDGSHLCHDGVCIIPSHKASTLTSVLDT